MHRFPVPDKPEGFDDAVKPFRERVAKFFTQGALDPLPTRKPKRAKPKPPEPANAEVEEEELFPPEWGRYKGLFSAHQNLKCGFCEGYAIGQSTGDVEHYTPKSAIEALDADDETSWGREVDNLANVVGRSPKPVSKTGYWWRAYEWDNYLLACEVCNRKWKKAIFPIKEARDNPPKEGDVETYLLLNPFRGEPADDHLRFGPMGEVSAIEGSMYGEHTIRTLGLDRRSLREQREPVARKVHKKIDALAKASVERRLYLLEDIRDEGQPDAAFCGMVRIIFEQRVKMSWAQLEAELAAAGKI